MRSLRAGRIDLLAYVRAFGLLARNPQIALAPLLAAVAQILLFKLVPAEAGAGFLGSANSSIAGLLAQLMTSFGLAVALIVAETAWRRGRAPFDTAWDDARRKVGAIVFAAFGFNFIIYVAGLVGGFLGSIGAYAVEFVAFVFFVYTIPAAAIGGLPGSAALNAAFERAQRTVAATALVAAVYLFLIDFAPSLILRAIFPFMMTSAILMDGNVVSIVIAIVKSILAGYVALVLAKAYDDASYGRAY
ncbi:MAG: hypothetical protein NVS3B17_08500 [Vulcanimicrobiaceae bacterium]